MNERASDSATARFERLLQPVLPVAYGVALRLARNQADAEDLIQDAALNAYRGFKGFQEGTNFKAWFMRILTNCFFAQYRKRRAAPETVNLDDAPPLYLYMQTLGAGMHAGSDDPAAALLGKLDAEAVAAAIGMLPEEFRVVTTLYFLDDMSYLEIAEILDRPLGTVRSRLHRGRRMLQKALWDVAQEQGIVTAGGAEK